MGVSGNYSLKVTCDSCQQDRMICEYQTKEEALLSIEQDATWKQVEDKYYCCDCKDKTIEPEIKFKTLKVVCLQCGHYLGGCYCDHYGSQCPHLNISKFDENGIAECFNCKRKINRDRDIV